MVILRGNLVPEGAVLKPSAATPELMQHRGRAVVFETIEDYKARIDDPDLDVDETCVLVLKNAGPKGYPGMAEVGNMGLPEKVLKKGVKDMVRVSDARMSGTAYGTVVLHACPEAAAGGPLALVQDGDMIELECREPQAASRCPGRRAGQAQGSLGRTRTCHAQRIPEALCRSRHAGLGRCGSRLSPGLPRRRNPARVPLIPLIRRSPAV